MKEVLQGLFGDVVTEENLLEFGRLFVSRAAFERLQREAAADLALWQAGAKNLTAAKLCWRGRMWICRRLIGKSGWRSRCGS